MIPFAQQSHVTVFAGRPAVLWPYLRKVAAPDNTLVVKLADGIGLGGARDAFRIAATEPNGSGDLGVGPATVIVVSHAQTYNDDHFNFCIKLAEKYPNPTIVLLALPDHVDWRDDAFPRPEDLDPAWRQFAANCILLYREADYFAEGNPTIIDRPLRRYEL